MNQKKILVIDDSEMDLKALTSVLAKRDFIVVGAPSGEDVVALVNQHKPDAVLVDILMPEVSGIDVVRKLRESHSPVELPILMVTIKSSTSDVVEALSIGANDYITKPIDFDVAVTRIQTHLKIVDLSRQLVRFKELEAVGALVATYNHEINSPLTIAMETLRRLKDQDKENVEKLSRAIARIAEVVKKIEKVTEKSSLEYSDYSKKSKVLKLR